MVQLAVLLLTNPVKSLAFAYSFVAHSLVIVSRRFLLPHYPVYQSLRIQFQRAYLAAASITIPEIVHRLPITNCPEECARKVGSGWTGYIIPGHRRLSDFSIDSSTSRQKCVAVYAHGGGYARGEARQYINYMERWIEVASQACIDLVFLSVEYPLSIESSHPTQRDSFIKAYEHLLRENVSPKHILFMGDSAGAALSILAALQLPKLGLPQPAGSVLISPWLDTSLLAYQGGSPLVESDYVITANTSVPKMFSLFLGGADGESPDVNPLYCDPKEIETVKLNPQLIMVGAAEYALQDGKGWAEICKKAYIKHKLVLEWGQLHIYAMGSKWLEPGVRAQTEKTIIDWIGQCVE